MIARGRSGWMTFDIVAKIFFWLCGCSNNNSLASGSKSTDPEAMQSCRSACELQLWPRVIVAIRDQNASELTDVRMRAFDQEGTQLPSYPHGCPELSSQYLCTYAIHGADEASEFSVYLHNGIEEISRTVALRPQNYCGRELAYLSVLSSFERRLTTENVVYISPCLDFDVP